VVDESTGNEGAKVYAACDPGHKFAVGGGGSDTGSGTLEASYPKVNGNSQAIGWYVKFTGSATGTVTVYVICSS
jgi:hypothetical protein